MSARPAARDTHRFASVADSADVDPAALVGEGTRVWHLAQVREHVRIGRDCIIGPGAYLGPGVVIGDRCKVQNYALLDGAAELQDRAFIGPAAAFTNHYVPRTIDLDGTPQRAGHWGTVGVSVREGASIGARAVCIAPVTIGRWAIVAAGSVVTRDVADFALVTGVPARRVRWVGRAGFPLHELGGGRYRCPVTSLTYVETDGLLTEDIELA